MSIISRYFAKNGLKKLHRRAIKDGTPPLAMFNMDVIGRHIACDGFFELKYLKALEQNIFPHLKKSSICIDIGANIGNHSVFFARHFDLVKSFEPNPRVFKLLDANSMLCDNIEIHNFGLSNHEQTLTAFYHSGNVGGASVSIDLGNENSVKFKLKRLDDVLTEGEKKKVSMIKIDVEGHELEALEGAKDTLNTADPLVIFEVLPSEIANGTSAAKQYLEEQGYISFAELADRSRINTFSPALARLYNALSVVFTGKEARSSLTPLPIQGALEHRPYAMVIASKTETMMK